MANKETSAYISYRNMNPSLAAEKVHASNLVSIYCQGCVYFADKSKPRCIALPPREVINNISVDSICMSAAIKSTETEGYVVPIIMEPDKGLVVLTDAKGISAEDHGNILWNQARNTREVT